MEDRNIKEQYINAIMVINGFSELLCSKDRTPEETKEYVANILAMTEQLEKLTPILFPNEKEQRT